MNNTNHISSLNLFYKDLEKIEGVKFTPRELDIVACIMNGRTSKKAIASFLSIQPSTVERHKHNILQKLGYNSWEEIRDYIEKTNKNEILRQIYKVLLVQENFKKSLKEISVHIKKTSYVFSIFFDQEKTRSLPLVLRTLKDLKNIGIKIISPKLSKNSSDLSIKSTSNYTFYFFSTKEAFFSIKKLQKKRKSPIKYIFSIIEGNPIQKSNQKKHSVGLIKLKGEESYYSFFFKILSNVFSDKKLNKKILELKTQYQALLDTPKNIFLTSLETHQLPNIKRDLKWNSRSIKKYKITVSFVIISIFCIMFFLIVMNKGINLEKEDNLKEYSVKSSLVVPLEHALLKRPDLIKQIYEKLDSQIGIQSVALIGIVGMGGVGKTTLARLFGRDQDFPIVYEINAETKHSLRFSFKELGKNLALKGNRNHKEEFEIIERIKDPEEQETRILTFVQNRLKESNQWVLIYDNVEALSDIKEYFPQEPKVWGLGKVIITTRNNNIKNSTYIKSSNIIQIDELAQDEALTLFTKILFECDPDKLDAQKRKENLDFIKNVPMFPLDISLAASYIKATKSPFREYLENLKEHTSDFEVLQEAILKESGDYTKTRSSIVTQSLRKIIEENADFVDLLVMISLLDSQNMPREVFDQYKNKAVVDNFMYFLKRYSLINLKNSDFVGFDSAISMHRSIQENVLIYLKKKQKLQISSSSVLEISKVLENCILNTVDKEEFEKTKILINHIEAFLKHDDLITLDIKGALYGVLGGGYYFLGYYTKAQQLLEESLSILKEEPQKNRYRIAQLLIHLGNVYRQQGNFKKAQSLFEESLEIYQEDFSIYYNQIAQILTYLGRINADNGESPKGIAFFERALNIFKKYDPQKYSKIAWILIYTGDVYREAGDYKKAKELQDQGLQVYKSHCLKEKHNHALASTLLGNTNRSLGYYKESKELLENSTKIYKELYGNRMPWASIHLGNTYRKLGMYKQSKEILEKTIDIYRKDFQYDNHYTAWAFVHLGNLYRNLGDFKKSKELIEMGIGLYRKIFQEDNMNMAWAFIHLGLTYASIEQYEQAKTLIEKNLAIHRRQYSDTHPKIAWIYWSLANIYMKLGDYKQAKDLLDKSLSIYEAHYGKDHIETARIWKDIGILSLLQNELIESEKSLRKALTIFEKNNHPDIYLPLESLGDLYLRKSALESANQHLSNNLKIQALPYFEKAFNIVKNHLPEVSPKINELKLKVEKIK